MNEYVSYSTELSSSSQIPLSTHSFLKWGGTLNRNRHHNWRATEARNTSSGVTQTSVKEGFQTPALATFWARQLFVVGTVLCIRGCWKASHVSTQQMAAPLPPRCEPKMPADIVKWPPPPYIGNYRSEVAQACSESQLCLLTTRDHGKQTYSSYSPANASSVEWS